MNTGHATMASTNPQNNLAANIPLPPGTPPPLHHQQQHQQHQQQHQQHQQQQLHHQQHAQQAQYPHQHIPIFGSNARQMTTFETLAKNVGQNVVENTLNQYGPPISMPAASTMSHPLMHSATAVPNLMQQRQLQHQQQQQQQMHQHQLLQRQQQLLQQNPLSYQQQTQVYQQQQQQQQHQQAHLLNQNAAALARNNTMQTAMTRPPVYIMQPMPPHCQPPPTSSVRTYHITPTSQTTPTAPTVNRNITLITPTSTTPGPTVASPPTAPLSPPLDTIKGSGHPNNITLTTPPHQQEQSAPPPHQEEKEKSPTPKKDLLTQVKEAWERWPLNQMIQEHKSLGQQLDASQAERARLEREINDLIRKNPGQNIELNAQFIRKKGDLTELGRKCEDINQAIKFVADKSDKKFGRKLENSNMRQPLQKAPPPPRRFQRAKMSTAAPSPVVQKPDSKDKKSVLFDLKDDNLWCPACDVHFKSLREYCVHLHKRDHSINVETTSQPPWRHNDQHKRQLGRYETFTKYKSICSEVDDTVDTEFKMIHLDAVLNPSVKDREDLKKLAIKRERKQFDDDDRLFSYKGYDEIMPITGYYCKLCDRTLCDEKEVETHLKGWGHNYEHARSVALQSSHERDFRVKMDKSLKALRAPEKPSTNTSKPKETTHRNVSSSAAHDKSPSTSNGLSSTGGARLPYKKPTSKIVDEHDIIADKFEKRKEKDQSAVKSADSRKDSSKSSKSPTKTDTPPKRTVPEIVPITENQPAAALKRLKKDKLVESAAPKKDTEKEKPGSQKKTDKAKPVIVGSSTEDEDEPVVEPPKTRSPIKPFADDVQILGEVHLAPGDPDSPFPHLDIVVSGNYPLSILRDTKLCKEVVVKMNRINLEDHKDILLDSSSVWNRVDKLMTKKEPGEFEKDLDTVTMTAPCFFEQDGKVIPASLERDSSDDEGKEFKMDSLQGFFCS